MSLIHLSTELRQELKLTPQLLQSMEVLQMNSQELLDYLNQVSEENPLVEQEDASALRSAIATAQSLLPGSESSVPALETPAPTADIPQEDGTNIYETFPSEDDSNVYE